MKLLEIVHEAISRSKINGNHISNKTVDDVLGNISKSGLILPRNLKSEILSFTKKNNLPYCRINVDLDSTLILGNEAVDPQDYVEKEIDVELTGVMDIIITSGNVHSAYISVNGTVIIDEDFFVTPNNDVESDVTEREFDIDGDLFDDHDLFDEFHDTKISKFEFKKLNRRDITELNQLYKDLI